MWYVYTYSWSDQVIIVNRREGDRALYYKEYGPFTTEKLIEFIYRNLY